MRNRVAGSTSVTFLQNRIGRGVLCGVFSDLANPRVQLSVKLSKHLELYTRCSN